MIGAEFEFYMVSVLLETCTLVSVEGLLISVCEIILTFLLPIKDLSTVKSSPDWSGIMNCIRYIVKLVLSVFLQARIVVLARYGALLRINAKISLS
jgi:hypothetical protein